MGLFSIIKSYFSWDDPYYDPSYELTEKYFKPLPIEEPKKDVIIPIDDQIEDYNGKNTITTIPLHEMIFITYKNAKGEISQRRITVDRIETKEDGDCCLKSYCHEREELRDFLLSRIIEISDISTGEVIDDPFNYFNGRYGDPEMFAINKVLEDFEKEILAMVFIGRSDGVLKKCERKVILDFISKKANVSFDTENLDKEIKRMNCFPDVFRKYLKHISEKSSDSNKEELLNNIEMIVKADKKVDQFEEAGLKLVKDILLCSV
jgi:hypothetical protein